MARTREFYGLDKNDKVLYLSGVPMRNLKNRVSPADLSFTVTSMANRKRTVTITAKRQQEVLAELILNIDSIGESGLFAIGSHPTEQAGYDLATFITCTFFNETFYAGKVPEVKWIDLGRPDWEFLRSNDTCDLCVIHGLSITSEPKRFDLARDFIHRAESCTIILVANADNILNFIVENIKVSPDIVWQLSKTTHEVFL
jgi:hypothetical protein